VIKMTWFEILKVNKANGMSARGFRGGDRRKARRGTTLEGGSSQDKLSRCSEQWQKDIKTMSESEALKRYEECRENAKR